VDSLKSLLLRGMHTTLIMSLHYLVKHKYPKMYKIYRCTKCIIIIFEVFNLNVKYEL